ncbi:MAG: trypsin-like peptidase domain-containing protein [Deltaproteobacteria bacterium]|nr:trypsin-like peptidase domain-containing protein [Deltaproteobacteria bacterium]
MRLGREMSHGLIGSLGIVAILLMSGCALPKKPIPVPLPPKPDAIIIEGGTSPVYFEKIVFRIPSGSRIGAVYSADRWKHELFEITYNYKFSETEEYNIEISDRLSELGYDAIDPTEGVFHNSEMKTRFRLVGVVSNLDIRTYKQLHAQSLTTKSQQVTLDMELRVYDARMKSVIYRSSYSGIARQEGRNANALPPAIMSAMEGALADPMFASSITSDHDAVSTKVATISIPDCERSAVALPMDIPTVSNAVVSVRLGSHGGSGVIISPAGHVLTAGHVVESGRTPMVTLANGLELEATVEALYKFSDVALLKIPGSNHQCVELMSAERIELGSEIYAMGSPLADELSGTVTRGIISGHPTIEGRELIQTDAAVNSGNSGGPIFNQRAQVAGIVTSKMFGFGVEGVAFAVPPETIREKLGLISE